MKAVEAFHRKAVVCLKGNRVALASLNKSDGVAEVYRLAANDIRLSTVALAQRAGRFVFADGNRLFSVDPRRLGPDAQELLLDVEDIVAGTCSVNWQVEVDEDLSSIYVSDIGQPTERRKLRILRIQQSEVLEVTIPFPHAGAYKIDPVNQRVLLLRNKGKRQILSIHGWDGTISEYELRYEYDYIELNSDRDAIVLSSLEPATVSVIRFDAGVREVAVAAAGAAAGWLTTHRLVYYAGNGHLVACDEDAGHPEEIIAVAAPHRPDRAVQPPRCDNGVLVWCRNPSVTNAAIVVDLDMGEFRLLPGIWSDGRTLV